MLDALAQLFSLVVQPCYDLTGSWWMAILLFTVIIKIMLMPLALWCQWNSIVMVKLMPDLNRVKVNYFGDQASIGEKQNKLNKKYHYHPLLSLIPLAVQILILFGLVEVIHGITDGGAPGTEFLGLVPAEDGGLSWVMPFLAALSAVVMGVAQNHINPLQREQSRAEKNSTNGLSILLSLVLGVYVATGMAFYWICSNLMAIVVQVLCNLIIKPERHVDYDDLHASQAALAELNALSPRRGRWWHSDPLARREKADYKRFFETVDKHLVVYSESSGFYKYLQGALEWLLTNSDVRVHYVTSDPDDQIFKIAENAPRIFPYYIGEKRLITLMMKLDADVVFMTLEDLDNFYLKRSYVRKDARYVFAFHHMTSTHLTAREDAYDHYDSLLCVGPHQVKEVHRAEELRDLPPKELVECGYDLLDREIAAYAERERPSDARPTILVAPSWQKDNILDSCSDQVIKPLLGCGYHVIVRPHPEYVKRYGSRWEALMARYSSYSDEELTFEQDFSTSDSIFDADVLVTDWSSIFCEFSFTTLKPCICVNTPMKVGNPNWKALGIEPTDIALRDKVGVSLDPESLDQLPRIVKDMLGDPERWRGQVEQARSQTVFSLGRGAEIAGRHLLNTILSQQATREGASTHEAR